MSSFDSDIDGKRTALSDRVGGRRKTRPQQPRKMLPWLIIAGLITAVWSFAATVGVSPPAGVDSGTDAGLAYLTGTLVGAVLGSGLVVGGLVALILHLVAGRRLTPGKGGVHFLILAAVAIIAALPVSGIKMVALHTGAATGRQLAAIDADYRTRSAAITQAPDLVQRITDAQALLRPDLVAAPGGLERARQANRELRSLSDSTMAELLALISGSRGRLEAVSMTAAQRTALSQDLDHEQALVDRTIAMTARVNTLRSQQLDVLGRAPRAWQVQGGSYVFQRQRDLEDFNRLALEVQALQTELATMRATHELAPAR